MECLNQSQRAMGQAATLRDGQRNSGAPNGAASQGDAGGNFEALPATETNAAQAGEKYSEKISELREETTVGRDSAFILSPEPAGPALDWPGSSRIGSGLAERWPARAALPHGELGAVVRSRVNPPLLWCHHRHHQEQAE